MDAILLAWAGLALLLVLYFAVTLIWGGTRARRMANIVVRERDRWPKVSVIVPARNEERNIRQGVLSILALDYPDFEVIAVNDRSTDRTGEILDELARGEPRLRVEHIRELPAGWLGKNHALHAAAQSATGEFLLFTDADVVFTPPSLRIAIQHCEEGAIDHLAATMTVVVPGWLLKAFVLTFGMFFLAYFKPWRVSNPKRREYVGIGAFNLVRAHVYRAIDGHAPIAMRPDDDVMLGKLVKIHGYRQDFLDGVDMMHVPWYGSLGEMIRGLEKNQFSGVEYSVPMVVSSSVLALLAFVSPFVMVFLTDGLVQTMFLIAAGVLWLLALCCAFAARLPIIAALAFPLAVLLFVFIQWRTMVLVLAHGGLQWRDTFYSLRELKANRLDWPSTKDRETLLRRCLVLLALLLGTALCARVNAQEVWRAGTGRANITPEQPMWMAGYGGRDHVAEGRLTDLWVKTLVLESPQGQTVLLITLDLVGIDRELAFAIREQLAERHGLANSQVMLCASHTHTGPVVGRNLAPMHYQILGAEQQQLVEAYEKVLITKIVDAVAQAIASKSECQLSWGSGKATFAVNRRNNRPEEEVPARRAIGALVGPVDHDVPVLAVRAPDGKLRAVVFGYACHATVLSFYQWSGDYPGFAQMELEQMYPDCTALFWAGCGADQNPLPRRTVELAQQYGRRLAQAVADVLDAPTEALGPHLSVDYAEVALPLAQSPGKEQLSEDARSTDKYVAARAQMWLDRLEAGQTLPTEYPYPIAVWKFGEQLEWWFLGGEVVVDYALRIKAERRQQRSWVAGYSNDVMAYIPSLRVLREGGYEGRDAMVYYGLLAPWTEQCEERILQQVHSLGGETD